MNFNPKYKKITAIVLVVILAFHNVEKNIESKQAEIQARRV